jgi:regulator of sigma E protease
MEIATNLAAFIPVIGIVIFVHEFGHFITAKAFGMRVFIFSFGFGKRLLGFKWGDTDCRLSLVPLGGYVKLEGEPDDVISEDVGAAADGRSFTSRPRWQRFVVYLAGPFMNAVLTVGVLTALHMIGTEVEASRFDRPIVGSVEPGSPAEGAAIQAGDEIVSIDGQAPSNWEDVLYHVMVRPGQPLSLGFRRGADVQTVTLRPTPTGPERVGTIGVWPLVRIGSVTPGGPAAAAGLRVDDAVLSIAGTPIRSFGGIPPIVGASEGKPLMFAVWRDGGRLEITVTPRDSGQGPRVGIGLKTLVRRFGPLQSAREALVVSWTLTRQTFDVLGRLLTGRLSPKSLMGPVGIAQASGDAARSGGLASLLNFVALISLQIGLFNLIVPIPVLDSGQMAILLVEAVRRQDLSLKVKELLMQGGVAAILLLVVLVLYSDLSKTSLMGRFLP